MVNLTEELQAAVSQAMKSIYDAEVDARSIPVQPTSRDFEGELTVVVFPLVRLAKQKPEQVGEMIGEALKERLDYVESFNVIKGFLNLRFSDGFWVELLQGLVSERQDHTLPSTDQTMVVEYCGPNTNKPLHLGHIRNMVIGYSIATILEKAGHNVHKVNIYNDRGIAICKSMVAWQQFGNGETPETSAIKGDHLVGKYYVKFAEEHAKQVEEFVAKGMDKEEATKQAPIQRAAQEMLLRWEQEEPETVALWRKMNDWVYAGFEETYQKLGVDFEKAYYESQTYKDGKALVEEGLQKGVFDRKADQSVWVNLEPYGLDEKLLLRSDGTSVYLTQDLGTAQARYEDYQMDQSIYVVANEQDYHFKALKATLQVLERPFADGIYHLSYGMVDLPTGKMKSREGTTVDADDLYDEMLATAKETTQELGKLDDYENAEAQELFRMLGMGALKYFLLKVNPRKRILFNPQESIEFQGDTGPFIQYTHARIRSVLRKWEEAGSPDANYTGEMDDTERDIALQLYRFSEIIAQAAAEYDPSHVANYVFNLAKSFNKFYADHPIMNAEDPGVIGMRIRLAEMTARVLKEGMALLGVDVPERM